MCRTVLLITNYGGSAPKSRPTRIVFLPDIIRVFALSTPRNFAMIAPRPSPVLFSDILETCAPSNLVALLDFFFDPETSCAPWHDSRKQAMMQNVSLMRNTSVCMLTPLVKHPILLSCAKSIVCKYLHGLYIFPLLPSLYQSLSRVCVSLVLWCSLACAIIKLFLGSDTNRQYAHMPRKKSKLKLNTANDTRTSLRGCASIHVSPNFMDM